MQLLNIFSFEGKKERKEMLKKVSGLGRLMLTKNNSSMMHEYEKRALKKLHLHPISTYRHVLQCMTYTNTYFKDKLKNKGFQQAGSQKCKAHLCSILHLFFFSCHPAV